MTLQAISNINTVALFDSFMSLFTAFVLGGLIGIERQYRQRTAGLRTNVLVAVGASIFVDIGHRMTGAPGAVSTLAYVVSGVGFLGAGVIMREEGNVRGINTAATLWGSAAVGGCAGADLIFEAIQAAAFVLAANTLLRPLVNKINREPFDSETVEATHTIFVIAPKEHQRLALQQLEQELDAVVYPTKDLTIRAFGEDAVKIEAVLSPTSIESEIMDSLTSRLSQKEFITQAFWNSSITD